MRNFDQITLKISTLIFLGIILVSCEKDESFLEQNEALLNDNNSNITEQITEKSQTNFSILFNEHYKIDDNADVVKRIKDEKLAYTRLEQVYTVFNFTDDNVYFDINNGNHITNIGPRSVLVFTSQSFDFTLNFRPKAFKNSIERELDFTLDYNIVAGRDIDVKLKKATDALGNVFPEQSVFNYGSNKILNIPYEVKQSERFAVTPISSAIYHRGSRYKAFGAVIYFFTRAQEVSL